MYTLHINPWLRDAIRALCLTAVFAASVGVFARESCARIPYPVGSVQIGTASWYGHPHHGRVAASGERYNMNSLTAAHRTLPFGTVVRVKNLSNDRTVEVQINDRGPFVPGRIIDLSRAAARALGMEDSGVSRVRLQVIELPARLLG